MPQTPLNQNTQTFGTTTLVNQKADAAGLLLSTQGGAKSALNVTAASVIKASPGRVAKLVIVAPGSGSGSFTLNDCLTTGTAAASNEVFTIGYAAAAAGAVYNLDFPFQVGIVLSAVPGAGSPVVAISYT
jgi:hypothetical protein